MRFHDSCALAGWLLLAIQASAQTVTPGPILAPIPAYQAAVSTAMIGFTASQTAQLSVVNLTTASTASSTAPTVACDVQLAFYDGQNALLKQGSTVNLAPGTATSLSLGHADLPASTATALRVSVRGQVKTTLVSPAASSASSGPAVIVVGACSPVVSLEIYETATGATQVFTSDTRAVTTSGAVPMAASLPAER